LIARSGTAVLGVDEGSGGGGVVVSNCTVGVVAVDGCTGSVCALLDLVSDTAGIPCGLDAICDSMFSDIGGEEGRGITIALNDQMGKIINKIQHHWVLFSLVAFLFWHKINDPPERKKATIHATHIPRRTTRSR
jgi:hypothetical protein